MKTVIRYRTVRAYIRRNRKSGEMFDVKSGIITRTRYTPSHLRHYKSGKIKTVAPYAIAPFIIVPQTEDMSVEDPKPIIYFHTDTTEEDPLRNMTDEDLSELLDEISNEPPNCKCPTEEDDNMKDINRINEIFDPEQVNKECIDVSTQEDPEEFELLHWDDLQYY